MGGHDVGTQPWECTVEASGGGGRGAVLNHTVHPVCKDTAGLRARRAPEAPRLLWEGLRAHELTLDRPNKRQTRILAPNARTPRLLGENTKYPKHGGQKR